MEILIGSIAAMTVIAVFLCGFFFGKKQNSKPLEPVSLDEEIRHWNEEQQRAFLECMSYSQEIAYGTK